MQFLINCIIALILLLPVVAMIILSLSSIWYPAQLIYIKTFGRVPDGKEYHWLKLAKAHLKAGKSIPILFLSDFSHMVVFDKEKYKKFLAENPFYFLVFPDKDLVLYSNEKIIICSFYNLVLDRLAKQAGYTKEDIETIRTKGIESMRQWEEKIRKETVFMQKRSKSEI